MAKQTLIHLSVTASLELGAALLAEIAARAGEAKTLSIYDTEEELPDPAADRRASADADEPRPLGY